MKHIMIICDYLLKHKLIDELKYREIFYEIGQLNDVLNQELSFLSNENFVSECLSIQDENLGLKAGLDVDLTQLGIYGLGLSLQSNIKDALVFSIKYQEVLWPLAMMSINYSGQKVYLNFESYFSKYNRSIYRFSLEYHIAFAYSLLTKYSHQYIKVLSISFGFFQTEDFKSYIRDCFDCEVFFGNHSYIEFEILTEEIKNKEQSSIYPLNLVLSYFEKLYFLHQKINISIRNRIFMILDSWGTDVPTEEKLAASLNLHPRTMRRRLEKEGITFRQVMIEYRKKKAENLLKTTDMSFKQIAFELWFRSGSSFSKAFESWCGIKPSIFREKNDN